MHLAVTSCTRWDVGQLLDTNFFMHSNVLFLFIRLLLESYPALQDAAVRVFPPIFMGVLIPVTVSPSASSSRCSVLWRRHQKKLVCRKSGRALSCDVHKWLVYRLTLVLCPNQSSTDDFFVYLIAQEGFC